MEEEKVIVVAGSADLQGTEVYVGNLSGAESQAVDLIGTVANETGSLSGTLVKSNEIGGVEARSGSLEASNIVDGATRATLSIRIGQDGKDGKDGFSPYITVHKDTKTEYILKVTNKDGSYLTPNLYPNIEGLQDIAALVAGKVDEDLLEYPVIDPNALSSAQRGESYIYTRTLNMNRKIALSEIALQQETDEKIKRKLQTVEAVPVTADWRTGDYILLDFVPIDN